MSLQFFEYAASDRRRPLYSSAWADNGTLLTAGAEGKLEAWNPLTGHLLPTHLQPQTTALSPADGITSLSLSSASQAGSSAPHSSAGQLALTSSLGGTFALHSIPDSYSNSHGPRTLAHLTLSPEQAARSTFVSAIRPQGDLFVGTGLGGGAHVWKIAAADDVALEPLSADVGLGDDEARSAAKSGVAIEWGMSCAFNEDGSQLAIGTRSGLVNLYAVSNERIAHLSSIPSHAAPVRTLAFTPLGSSHLVAGSDDRLITVHDVRLPASASDAGAGGERMSNARWKEGGGGVVACLQGHSGWIRGVAPAKGSTGDRLIASVSQDGSVRLWDISLSPKTSVFSTPANLSNPLSSITWSPASSATKGNTGPDSEGSTNQSGVTGSASGAGTGSFATTSEGNLGASRSSKSVPNGDSEPHSGAQPSPQFPLLPSASPVLSFFRSASSVVCGPTGLEGQIGEEEALLEDVERRAEGAAE
ncbi:unnamed protein product [Tilletia controversa]|uniref:Anaphase-promoting complex subunit 4 WD40 domain-containing protein n=2 Tax=Tilletia TaxID=13289 RepID=A0A9N8LLK8_9BASI|nr:hypothetical protein CF336_g2456 [Tilletia laevis]CAD6887378.1 unnamed protein product [Tilletia caries]CAD6928125.1 unnamed protein product [Tilletia controversa]KAE8205215.1 hypothetical protein CF335_g2381 [Tilletia laevis]CAD6897770.1 unnamed protein product [Tilletia caries]